MTTLGAYIKQYRSEHHLSMQALGERCGLTRAYISVLEKGVNPTTGKPIVPTLQTLIRLANAMQSTPEELMELAGIDEKTLFENDLPLMQEYLAPKKQQAEQNADSEEPDISHAEYVLLQKFRALDNDGKSLVRGLIDMRLSQLGLEPDKVCVE